MGYAKAAAVILFVLMVSVPFVSVSDSEGTAAADGFSTENLDDLIIEGSAPVDKGGAHWDGSTLTMNNTHFSYVSMDVKVPELKVVLEGKNVIDKDNGHGMEITNSGNVTISGGELEINLADEYGYGVVISRPDDFNADNGKFTVENTKITINTLQENEDGYSTFLQTMSNFDVYIRNSQLYGTNQCYGIDVYPGSTTSLNVEKSLISFKSPYYIEALDANNGIYLDTEPGPKDQLKYYDLNGATTDEWKNGEISEIDTEGEFFIDTYVYPTDNDTPMKIVVIAFAAIAVICFGYCFFGKK